MVDKERFPSQDHRADRESWFAGLIEQQKLENKGNFQALRQDSIDEARGIMERSGIRESLIGMLDDRDWEMHDFIMQWHISDQLVSQRGNKYNLSQNYIDTSFREELASKVQDLYGSENLILASFPLACLDEIVRLQIEQFGDKASKPVCPKPNIPFLEEAERLAVESVYLKKLFLNNRVESSQPNTTFY